MILLFCEWPSTHQQWVTSARAPLKVIPLHSFSILPFTEMFSFLRATHQVLKLGVLPEIEEITKNLCSVRADLSEALALQFA